MSEHLLKNAVDTTGKRLDIRVRDGFIVEMGSIQGTGIDCDGLLIMPGFVDVHTHLREPGYEASETVLTGSQSAAAGGYTAVCSMANTLPVSDTAELVEEVQSLGEIAGYVEVQPIGAVTRNLAGKELSRIADMHASKAKVSIFSDDGACVFDSALMEQALLEVKRFGGVIAQHAQDPELTVGAQMNEGALATELGLVGWPSIAEEKIIERDALLAKKTGSRLHICHLTTAGAVDVVRWAKREGINITAEVTPHHLLLTEELVRSYDPVYKVNPPLRKKEDTLALREALIDGTIDALGTDHAPHSAEKKDCEWNAAAFGMVGLENAGSVLQEVLIASGASNWARFASVISAKPAEIAGLKSQGQLRIGSAANLTLWDSNSKRVVAQQSASKSKNNPFAGMELPGHSVMTMFRGRFTVIDSKLVQL